MTSSLVGSEMCIRDSSPAGELGTPHRGSQLPLTALADFTPHSDRVRPVSYTHLTLPTICSV
eukprot:7323905-Prorocentrum_lima.AAC.1